MYFHRASWHSSATLTEVFPCFFLSCKANARVKPAKMGHGPHFSIFVFFYVLFVLCRSVYCLCCKCALYYCHRVATQLQFTNISYHITIIDSSCTKLYFHMLKARSDLCRKSKMWRLRLQAFISNSSAASRWLSPVQCHCVGGSHYRNSSATGWPLGLTALSWSQLY
jgi:hypothetical protein